MTSNLLAALKSKGMGGRGPLTLAVLSGDLDRVQGAVAKEEKLKVDQKDIDGCTPLMHAASAGYMDICQ